MSNLSLRRNAVGGRKFLLKFVLFALLSSCLLPERPAMAQEYESILAFGLPDAYELGVLASGTGYHGLVGTPTRVQGALSTESIVEVGANVQFSLAVTARGGLYYWGSAGKWDQTPAGTVPRLTPTLFSGDLSSVSVIQVSMGGGPHQLALSSIGDVYAWGANPVKQCALAAEIVATPTRVGYGLNGTQVTEVATGDDYSAALSSTGHVYTWGHNGRGQLGITTSAGLPGGMVCDGCCSDLCRQTPTMIYPTAGMSVTALWVGAGSNWAADGRKASMVVTSNGLVYAWGYNFFSQLGTGEDNDGPNRGTPTLIVALVGKSVLQVSVSDKAAFAVVQSGQLYAWGGPDYVGFGNHGNTVLLPTIVPGLAHETVHAIFGGIRHVLCMTSGGLYGWGFNGYQELGLRMTSNPVSRITPTLILPSSGLPFKLKPNVRWMSAGMKYSLIYAVVDGPFPQCSNVKLVPNKYIDGPGPVTVRYPWSNETTHAKVPPCWVYADGVRVNISDWGQEIAIFSTKGMHTVSTLIAMETFPIVHIYDIGVAASSSTGPTVVSDPCTGGESPELSPFLQPASYIGPGPVTVYYIGQMNQPPRYRQLDCTIWVQNKPFHIDLTQPGQQKVATFSTRGAFQISYCSGSDCRTNRGNPTSGSYTLQSDCPAGRFQNPTNATCDACPAGRFGPTAGAVLLSDCVKCPSGRYSPAIGNSSAETCLGCGKGTYTSVCSGAAECTKCKAGTFNPRNTSGSVLDCLPCASGEYSDNAGAFKCQRCATGTFAVTVGHSVCSNCPAGTFSTIVGGNTSFVCTACVTGSFSSTVAANSSATCQPCPANSTTRGDGKSDRTSCECRVGYGGLAADACTLCDAGTFKATVGFEACSLCNPGRWSNASGASSSSFCYECARGTYGAHPGASTATGCVRCVAGKYGTVSGASHEMTGCTVCPTNATSVVGSTNKLDCQCNPGYHGVDGGTCSACSQGTYKDTVGPSTCDQCAIGTYTSDVGSSNSDACTCNAGLTRGPNVSASCSLCSQGRFKVVRGFDDCAPCPAGTWSSVRGASTSTICVECPIGTYGASAGGSASTSACLACESGKYGLVVGASNAIAGCGSCPGNAISPPASPNKQSCECNAGYHGFNGGSCTPCAEGTWQSSLGASQCTACSNGLYTTGSGSSSSASCQCNVGHSGFSSTTCVPCSAGLFKSAPGFATCSSCPMGTWGTATGASSSMTCTGCPIGTYGASAGGSASTSACLACESGKYGLVVGASNAIAGCGSCPDNAISPPASPNKQSCECNAGYHGFNGGSCTPCAEGTWQSSLGASQCTACSNGRYTVTQGATSLDACVCNAGFSGRDCAPCALGKYKTNVDFDDCSMCPLGTFGSSIAATSSEACLDCMVGTYGVSRGITSALSCPKCAPGKYGSIAGARTETQGCAQSCPVEATSDWGSTSIFDCKCNAGFQGANGAKCTSCDVGKFKENTGSARCMHCPVGSQSTSTSAGDTSLSVCSCSPGYTGTGGANCQPCPGGTYKAIVGSISCENCYAGTWSSPASTDCTKCGVGTFSAVVGASSGACATLPTIQRLIPSAQPVTATSWVAVVFDAIPLSYSAAIFSCFFDQDQIPGYIDPNLPGVRFRTPPTTKSPPATVHITVRVSTDASPDSMTRKITGTASLLLYAQPVISTITPRGVLYNSDVTITLTSTVPFAAGQPIFCCFGTVGNAGCDRPAVTGR